MSSQVFADIFLEEFGSTAASTGRERFASLWHAGGAAWTSLMVHGQNRDSVLERTTYRWGQRTLGNGGVSLHHWYTVDIMAVTPPFQEVEYWETSPAAVIEHENRKDIETELWKLAHWRAPLKVLVFYRFEDNSWLDSKFNMAHRIVETAQRPSPESNVEYLLMAGCREKERVSWRVEQWHSEVRSWNSQHHESAVWVG